jgi:Sigma-70 region 2
VSAIAAAAGETSSDESLVEQIAAGSKLAMRALFARHRTYVYRWLLRFVSNETLAEDLLSEVFLDMGGFGGRIIQQIIAQAKGESRFDWRAEGLVCELTLRV